MIEVDGKNIGSGHSCFIIAEIGMAHDGSLGMAHSYIDAVAKTGADAIKFQTHIASAESTKQEQFRINFSYEDNTRYDYWKRLEFTESQWLGLKEHCDQVGITFLSSPFSKEAVQLLDKIGTVAWKVGSGEISSLQLLNSMLSTNKPILASSGMSSWEELDHLVALLEAQDAKFALFQCTSKYPTPLSQTGINIIDELIARYSVPVGLSDHSGTVYPSMMAMANGASLIEVHAVFSKQMFGPDSIVSLTMDQLTHLVEARDAFYEMRTNPVDKDEVAKQMAPMRKLFNKSVVIKQALASGTILDESVLLTKKPGTGIPAADLEKCIGKRLVKDLPADHILQWTEFEK